MICKLNAKIPTNSYKGFINYFQSNLILWDMINEAKLSYYIDKASTHESCFRV